VTCWVVIPAKAPPEAKGRLAGALDAASRANLAEAMLKRAVSAASSASGAAGMAIVGQSLLDLPNAIELLREPGGGLNAAVTSARSAIKARGGSRIVTLAADLPQVTTADVEALCNLPAGVIGIAPDRYGTGTNALSLPLPEALGFTYSYGIGSCALHKAEATRLGLTVQLIETPGLARDIDEAADLADAQDLLARQEG
jgi:2-phospho-L-lactate guanylyltransferase